jgi:hypothetical protein
MRSMSPQQRIQDDCRCREFPQERWRVFHKNVPGETPLSTGTDTAARKTRQAGERCRHVGGCRHGPLRISPVMHLLFLSYPGFPFTGKNIETLILSLAQVPFMKLLVAVLLMCLLVAGTASAVALSPASAGAAVKTVTPVPTHAQVARIPASVLTGVMVTQGAGRGMLEVYSVPSGAGVNLDGANTTGEVTPIKYSLPAGSHSVVIYLEGYELYRETFNLDAGAIKDINADLKRKVSASSALAGMEARDTRKPDTPTTIVSIPGALTRITTIPVPITTTPTITAVCPNSDWSCLTGDEAAQQFGYPNARYGDEPCGFVPVNNAFVYKYCYMDVPSGSLSPGALAASGIKEGDDIYIMNDTWIEHAVVNKSPEARKTGEAGSNPFQSFLDFVSGIVSGSSKPTSRLDIVGFNPQPEPPGAPLPDPMRLK